MFWSLHVMYLSDFDQILLGIFNEFPVINGTVLYCILFHRFNLMVNIMYCFKPESMKIEVL